MNCCNVACTSRGLPRKQAEFGFEPGQIEQLAARALGGRQVQIRFIQQFPQQGFVDFAAGSPGPVRVEFLAFVQGIQASSRRLAGPVSKPVTLLPRFRIVIFAMPPKLAITRSSRVAAKNLIVKHRQERRALSAGRHIAAAKVRRPL